MERRELTARDGTKLVFVVFPQTAPGAAATPLVCVCGLSSVKEDWFGVIALLRGERAVAVLDNRGIGESYETTRKSFTSTDQSNDVIDMMDALKWPSAIVWGHSMGGRIAQLVALSYPQRVARLILLGGQRFTFTHSKLLTQSNAHRHSKFVVSPSAPSEGRSMGGHAHRCCQATRRAGASYVVLQHNETVCGCAPSQGQLLCGFVRAFLVPDACLLCVRLTN